MEELGSLAALVLVWAAMTFLLDWRLGLAWGAVVVLCEVGGRLKGR